LCDRDIATNFGVVAGEVILVDSCALFLFAVIIIFLFFLKRKKRRNIIFASAVLFTYGSGTVQNRFFGGIRYRPFVS
jgi:hypothetical protein